MFNKDIKVFQMTGEKLHQILLDKWGRSYDIQVRRTKGKIFIQVMWKYLEQVSFPLSQREYLDHLNTVSTYINAWGVASVVEEFITKTNQRPRLGKAVNIPLNLGARASEWILEDF